MGFVPFVQPMLPNGGFAIPMAPQQMQVRRLVCCLYLWMTSCTEATIPFQPGMHGFVNDEKCLGIVGVQVLTGLVSDMCRLCLSAFLPLVSTCVLYGVAMCWYCMILCCISMAHWNHNLAQASIVVPWPVLRNMIARHRASLCVIGRFAIQENPE